MIIGTPWDCSVGIGVCDCYVNGGEIIMHKIIIMCSIAKSPDLATNREINYFSPSNWITISTLVSCVHVGLHNDIITIHLCNNRMRSPVYQIDTWHLDYPLDP